LKTREIEESGGKNRKNPSEGIDLFNFSTIRKMSALRNGRNRRQIDSVWAFILCPAGMSIFLDHKKCHYFRDFPARRVESAVDYKTDIFLNEFHLPAQ
jgi:hypothetical protein